MYSNQNQLILTKIDIELNDKFRFSSFVILVGLSAQNILLERCLFIFSISIGSITVDTNKAIENVTQKY